MSETTEFLNIDTLRSRLKTKLLKTFLKNKVRTVFKTRVYFNSQMFRSAIVAGNEPDFPLERVICISGDIFESSVGYIFRVYEVTPAYAEVLIQINKLPIAWEYQTGSKYLKFKVGSDFYTNDAQSDIYFWIKMKRKYKEIKQEQEKTKKLRLQGKIGRTYFEEW